MPTLKRGNRGTPHKLAELTPQGRTVRIRTVEGNVDHTLVFDTPEEHLEFICDMLGKCPAVLLAAYEPFKVLARMALALDEKAYAATMRPTEGDGGVTHTTRIHYGQDDTLEFHFMDVAYSPEYGILAPVQTTLVKDRPSAEMRAWFARAWRVRNPITGHVLKDRAGPTWEQFNVTGTTTGRTSSATPNAANTAPKHYLEAGGEAGAYCWRIYHYDPTGERELLDRRSGFIYDREEDAIDAGVQWAEENKLEVELV